jgi:L-ascorbate metabolism protein UlaG (beta-lactamase superfamily)
MKFRPNSRWMWALYVPLALSLALVALTWFATNRFAGFGYAPDERSLARMHASPHFHDGEFVNLEGTHVMRSGKTWEMLKRNFAGDEMRAPICPLPLVRDAARRLATPPASGLRITWLGHSTTLVEIDGMRILTDPIWSERSSPTTWVGPKRFHPPPLALADVPHLDAVIISHEHFDHLDMATVQALAPRGVPFHVPLGIGSHLRGWGVPDAQVHEHDWWESESLPSGLRIVSTPSRHFNGRGAPGRTGTFWTSWSLIGPTHRVFFSGDTGLTEQFREIRRRFGPFDAGMFEIGQFDPLWSDIHLGPRGALDAQEMLGARVMIPIHWATYQLAFHSWSEPAETLVREAALRTLPVLTPRLGEAIEPTANPHTEAWWRALPPIAARCP